MPYKIKVLKSPNNETRITLYPIRRKGKSVRQMAAEFLGVSDDELKEKGCDRNALPENFPTLDIRSEFRTGCSAHEYKRTTFGKNAKTRIMRAAGAMDRNDAAPWHYVFLTATLPSNDEWAKWAIAENSAWIIDTIKSWMSKRQAQRKEFYVWEMQKRGALHFHWCVYCPKKEIRDKYLWEFRLEWMRLLQGVEKRSGISMWGRFADFSETAKYCIVQVKVEEINKSVAAYMAGYCGTKKDKHSIDKFIPYYPRRWFGISRPLSANIEELTEEIEMECSSLGESKNLFQNLYDYFCEDSVRSQKWHHNVGVGETSVHYHSQEKSEELWESRKMKQRKALPNLHWLYFSRMAANCMKMHSELVNGCQGYRQHVSGTSLDCLEDSLYREAALRGHLRDVVIQSMERLYSCLASHTNLPRLQEALLKDVERFCHLHSKNYPLMKFDRSGWMVDCENFSLTVDKNEESGDSRTNGDTSDTPGNGAENLLPSKGDTLTPCPSHTMNFPQAKQLTLLEQKK